MKNGIILSVYGDNVVSRAKCPKCRDVVFVVNKKTICCNKEVDTTKILSIKQMVGSNKKRRKPPKGLQDDILKEQDNKCIYCGEKFVNKDRYLEIHFDHFVPYSFTQNNNNFVAACGVCNIIKGSNIFYGINEARKFITGRRKKNGSYSGISIEKRLKDLKDDDRDRSGKFLPGRKGEYGKQFSKEWNVHKPKDYWYKNWLVKEYITKNRSADDIAVEFSVSTRTIRMWLSKHGISKIK